MKSNSYLELMMLSFFLEKAKKHFRQALGLGCSTSYKSPFHRLRIEFLEDRLAPATFTVQTLADQGAHSLRAILDGSQLSDDGTGFIADNDVVQFRVRRPDGVGNRPGVVNLLTPITCTKNVGEEKGAGAIAFGTKIAGRFAHGLVSSFPISTRFGMKAAASLLTGR